MKKTIYLIVILLFIAAITKAQYSYWGVSGLFTLDNKNPEVTLISPDGGEYQGFIDPVNVAWTATDDSFGTTPISIAFSTEPGGSYTLSDSNLSNTGSAVVNPPGILTATAKAQVIATDSFGNSSSDTSSNYFIFTGVFAGLSETLILDSKPPVVNVISPDGGELYSSTDPLPVQWNATDDSFGSTPVSIAVSDDGGGNYNTVATDLPNTGSADVTATVITSQAKVKVTAHDTFGLTSSDESNAVFTLQGFYLDLKTFLEGPYTGNEMLPTLNSSGYLPLSQPYSSAPWSYTGSENVTSIPNGNVVDWVLVELRDAADAPSASSATRIARQAAFVLKDGQVVSTNGSGMLMFGTTVSQGLFAVVMHRNHLGVISSSPLTSSGNLYSYDFTSGQDMAYGGSEGHKQIGSGVWGMFAGDGNADGHITTTDKISVWKPQSGLSGYKAGDYSLNGQVNNNDKNLMWRINLNRLSQVPE